MRAHVLLMVLTLIEFSCGALRRQRSRNTNAFDFYFARLVDMTRSTRFVHSGEELIKILEQMDEIISLNRTLYIIKAPAFNSTLKTLYESIIDAYAGLYDLSSFGKALDMISYQNGILEVLSVSFWIRLPERIQLRKISRDISELIKFVVDKVFKNNDIYPFYSDSHLGRRLISLICVELRIPFSFLFLQDMVDYYVYGNESLLRIPDKIMEIDGKQWIVLDFRCFNHHQMYDKDLIIRRIRLFYLSKYFPINSDCKIGFWCNDEMKNIMMHLLRSIRLSVMKVKHIDAWLIGCVSGQLEALINRGRRRAAVANEQLSVPGNDAADNHRWFCSK